MLKQLALIFGFDVLYNWLNGRVLVYGDNQFALEIESLDLPLWLYLFYASGYWFLGMAFRDGAVSTGASNVTLIW